MSDAPLSEHDKRIITPGLRELVASGQRGPFILQHTSKPGATREEVLRVVADSIPEPEHDRLVDLLTLCVFLLAALGIITLAKALT